MISFSTIYRRLCLGFRRLHLVFRWLLSVFRWLLSVFRRLRLRFRWLRPVIRRLHMVDRRSTLPIGRMRIKNQHESIFYFGLHKRSSQYMNSAKPSPNWSMFFVNRSSFTYIWPKPLNASSE